MRERINNQIRAAELRVIDADGRNLGVLKLSEALQLALAQDLDLIEISPEARPPVAKIMEYGKFQYTQSKKLKKIKSAGGASETKSAQVKIGTSEHDLGVKAKMVSGWIKEGHRVKVELYLSGRARFMEEKFLATRLDRILKLISEKYKIAEPVKRVPKGLMVTIEKI